MALLNLEFVGLVYYFKKIPLLYQEDEMMCAIPRNPTRNKIIFTALSADSLFCKT